MAEPRYELTAGEGYQLIKAILEIRSKSQPTEGMTAVDAERALESVNQLANDAIAGIPHAVISTANLL